MKSFSFLSFLLVLVLGSFVSETLGQQTADYERCKDGSDLIAPPECPEDDDGHSVYFPFPYDCTQYFACTNGNARCIQCAPGTVWDQENLVCNHPAAVNCTIVTTPITSTTIPTTTTTTEPTTPTPTTAEPTTPDPTTPEPTTPEPTTPVDPTTPLPTTAEPTTPEPTTPVPTTPEPTTPVPTTPEPTTPVDPTTPVPTTPEPTTPVDPTTPLPTTPEPTTPLPTTAEPTTPEPTTPVPTTTTTTTPGSTTQDDPASWVCPEGYEGFIRHPYNCQLFYQCDSGRRPCLFECQSGLYFSPELERCEFPEKVSDCVGGSPPPTSTTPKYGDAEKFLNYRTVNRDNFVQTVKYVSNMLKGKVMGDVYMQDPDPCQEIKSYLGIA